MKLIDLLTYAIAGSPSGDLAALDEITMFSECWYDLLDTSLEDLNLSRLDLDEQERDYLSIEGSKL